MGSSKRRLLNQSTHSRVAYQNGRRGPNTSREPPESRLSLSAPAMLLKEGSRPDLRTGSVRFRRVGGRESETPMPTGHRRSRDDEEEEDHGNRTRTRTAGLAIRGETRLQRSRLVPGNSSRSRRMPRRGNGLGRQDFELDHWWYAGQR